MAIIYQRRFLLPPLVILCGCLIAVRPALGDAATDWNVKACDIAVEASLPTPYANRALAIVHTAIFEAVNAITRRYPKTDFGVDAPNGASVDSAVAAASHVTLLKLFPLQKDSIEAAYHAALAKIPDGKSKSDGITVGENSASAILSRRIDDGISTVEEYRPYTIAGVYVPTALPLVSHWLKRKPWLMTSASQFRPGPPPKLASELWARDYNEIKAVGGKTSATRTVDQSDIARFWEETGPVIYHGIVRSVTTRPGREITQNARLLMAVTQAVDDAMIAVFDAKYFYNFWRPVTAIRNGDIDGNDATERDPSWTPFINTPMHPEYPCAHCIVAGAVGTVLQAEIGNAKVPVLATSSSTAKNAKRTWTNIDDFILEVSNGRIYDGVHFRNSTEVGTAMGREIGKLAVAKYLGPIK
jgi:hypothetical protein